MKEFRLSTPTDRATGISISVGAIVCLGLLVYSLRDQLGLMILCGLCGLLIAVLLVCYVVNVLRAACIVNISYFLPYPSLLFLVEYSFALEIQLEFQILF